jgi:hypothetical protein
MCCTASANRCGHRGGDTRYDLDRLTGLDTLPPPWVPHLARALANTGIPIREALRVADGRFWRLDGDDLTDVYHTAHRTTAAKVTTPAQRDALVAELQRRAGVNGGW